MVDQCSLLACSSFVTAVKCIAGTEGVKKRFLQSKSLRRRNIGARIGARIGLPMMCLLGGQDLRTIRTRRKDRSGDLSSPLVSAIVVPRSMGDLGVSRDRCRPIPRSASRMDNKGPPNSQFIISNHRDHFFTNSAQGKQQQEASV